MPDATSPRPRPRPARRSVLQAAAAVPAVGLVGALAGCSADGGDEGSGAAPAAGQVLTAATEVPVGGGVVLGQVVVTQPQEGTFRAFDAVCTHQACRVSTVSEGSIVCPCHNSRFSVEDGSVQTGPATEPLGEVAVVLEGDEVVRA